MFLSTLNTTSNSSMYYIHIHTHNIDIRIYVCTYIHILPSADRSWDGKSAQDAKGYATACHKCSQYLFLLLIMVRYEDICCKVRLLSTYAYITLWRNEFTNWTWFIKRMRLLNEYTIKLNRYTVNVLE